MRHSGLMEPEMGVVCAKWDHGVMESWSHGVMESYKKRGVQINETHEIRNA